ncbi:MAG: hypothetical protein Q9220_000170 [cf. Caloplaca sp. 1 TL-2023]
MIFNISSLFTLLLLPTFLLSTSAFPLADPSTNASFPDSLPAGNVSVPRPPKAPLCTKDMSPPGPRTMWFARNCADAVARIPRDVRPASPMRNFYLQDSDINPSMPNQKLPFEVESGDCIVRLLIASSFLTNTPHDTAAWMDIWGPARTILQQCVLPTNKNTGGIITHVGTDQKLDLVIYSKRSLFALTRRLKESKDAVATSIAENEFLQLLGLVGGVDRGELESAAAALAAEGGVDEEGGSGNATIVAGSGGGDGGAVATA